MAVRWAHVAMRGGEYIVGTQTFTVGDDGTLSPDPEPATADVLRRLPTVFAVEVPDPEPEADVADGEQPSAPVVEDAPARRAKKRG